MDRRTFLELGASGLAGACLPGSLTLVGPATHVENAMTAQMDALMTACSQLGIALTEGKNLPRRNLRGALELYQQSLASFEEALRIDPTHVGRLELFADAQLEAASLEILLGGDPRTRIEKGLACTKEWLRLAPNDPIAKGALAFNEARARHLFEEFRDPVPDPIPPLRATRVMGTGQPLPT
jgi:hypothetical protein